MPDINQVSMPMSYQEFDDIREWNRQFHANGFADARDASQDRDRLILTVERLRSAIECVGATVHDWHNNGESEVSRAWDVAAEAIESMLPKSLISNEDQ